jgi:hypothetical protein
VNRAPWLSSFAPSESGSLGKNATNDSRKKRPLLRALHQPLSNADNLSYVKLRGKWAQKDTFLMPLNAYALLNAFDLGGCVATRSRQAICFKYICLAFAQFPQLLRNHVTPAESRKLRS